MTGTVDRDIGQSVVSHCGAAASAVAIFHDGRSRGSQRQTGGGTRLTQQCTRSIMHRQKCIRPTRFGCTASTGSKCTRSRRATPVSAEISAENSCRSTSRFECNIRRTASGITPSRRARYV